MSEISAFVIGMGASALIIAFAEWALQRPEPPKRLTIGHLTTYRKGATWRA